MQIFTIIVLLLSGLLLTMVGFFRLSNPIGTYLKNSGISIANDVDLLNEVRGFSALMLSSGIIILLGTILSQVTVASLIIATLVFIGVGIGRTISWGIDGKPNKLILQGMIWETVLGASNLIALINVLN